MLVRQLIEQRFDHKSRGASMAIGSDMEMAVTPELKGFDSYDLKLGDELRGERASRGKTLLDVQRDLRIRADYIDAIENADASAFPFSGFAAGYVRSYARYLGLDADDVYRRFCAESGFEGAEANASVTPNFGDGASKAAASGPVASSSPIQTKYMPSSHDERRIEIGASLRGLASIGVLGALVVGLGYGGWTMLQNIQRVGFAPLPTAPTVQLSAPDFLSPTQVAAAEAPLAAEGDATRTTLAALYAEQEFTPAAIEPRDGPIASIDPATAGIYAPPAMTGAPDIAMIDDDMPLGTPDASILRAAAAEDANRAAKAARLAAGVTIFAKDEAWVRVRDGDSDVLFSGILGAGEQFILPEDAETPQLRAGNAGAVYIIVAGEAFGPLGNGPEVAKGVQLTPDAVRAAYPAAEDVAFPALSRNAGTEDAAADDREASLPSELALSE